MKREKFYIVRKSIPVKKLYVESQIDTRNLCRKKPKRFTPKGNNNR